LRIGYWPWELPAFPNLWADVYHLVDEIWTGSEFSAQAYRTNCRKPVNCLPAPVSVPAVPRRRSPDIRPGTFVFTYAFDPNSYMKRKNPVALVRAFRSAFPPSEHGVVLLLRANGSIPRSPRRRALLHAIGTDRRITLVEETLDRTEALALMASCHCLVSPHRAEGFGRNIAEAILLEIPVLATAYSGCMDFLEPEERLSFAPTKVEAGEYPFAEGLMWADPDVTDMAAKMKLARTCMRRGAHNERQRLAARARKFAHTYSPQPAGQRFLDRLTELGAVEPASQDHHVRTGKTGRHLGALEATFATGC
jgi:glycosyltransferase involved in cell wall biosynthesis